MVGPSSQHWAQRAAGLTSQGDNASWAQMVRGAEREQWGGCSLIMPFTHAALVECFKLCPVKRRNCSCCGR